MCLAWRPIHSPPGIQAERVADNSGNPRRPGCRQGSGHCETNSHTGPPFLSCRRGGNTAVASGEGTPGERHRPRRRHRLLLLLSCRYLHFHIARQRGQRHGPRRPPRHSTLGPAHAPGFCTTGRGQQREPPGLRGRGRQLGGVISVLLGGGPLRLLTVVVVVVRCSPPRPRTSAFP